MPSASRFSAPRSVPAMARTSAPLRGPTSSLASALSKVAASNGGANGTGAVVSGLATGQTPMPPDVGKSQPA